MKGKFFHAGRKLSLTVECAAICIKIIVKYLWICNGSFNLFSFYFLFSLENIQISFSMLSTLNFSLFIFPHWMELIMILLLESNKSNFHKSQIKYPKIATSNIIGMARCIIINKLVHPLSNIIWSNKYLRIESIIYIRFIYLLIPLFIKSTTTKKYFCFIIEIFQAQRRVPKKCIVAYEI